jgi:hypothetical protein
MDDLLNKYTTLNNSFKKTYIFHIGANAGFYSEFCNMVFAILYCLKYEYKFIIYSKDANFGYKNGWNDFFLPFCKETTCAIHKYYNTRNYKPVIRKRHLLIWKIYRFLNKKTLLTYELWDKYFCKDFDNAFFDIPTLGIRGNLRDASIVIAKMIYRFNNITLSEIEEYTSSIDLPSEYNSMQIRRGDKITECTLCPIHYYFDAANNSSNIKDLFILTDDYSVIEEVKSSYPEWSINTLTTTDEMGYNHKLFSQLNSSEKKQKLIKLFASIELIRKSQLFIGTYTTNIGLFLGMVKPLDKIISVQKKEWFRFADDDIKEQLL